MDLPPPLNHVFVDYENVQAIDLNVIGSKGVTFTLLLGPQKKKLDVELVEQLFAHAASVELVRLAASGKNALDFSLAYYIGRAVAADPAGFFHIISHDTGYDPMIKHLQSRHIRIRRHENFSKLTFAAVPKLKPSASAETVAATSAAQTAPKITAPYTADPITRVLAHLRKQVKNRPKKRKGLLSHLTFLGKQSTETNVAKLIEELVKAGYVVIDEKDSVAYSLPAGG